AVRENDEARAHITQLIGPLSSAAIKDSDVRSKNLQSLLRLTDDAELREKTLAELRKLYKVLPDYQKVPTFRFTAPGRKEAPRSNSTPVSDNRHTAIVDELLFLNLYDEAAPEFDAGTRTEAQSPDLAYTGAVLYNRGDMADRAVAFAEPFWKTVPADYQIELIPADQLNLLYPAPYVDSFLKSALQRGIAPRFMLSIIRQESRYRPDLKSYAAPRGLMQFNSTTSEQIGG